MEDQLVCEPIVFTIGCMRWKGYLYRLSDQMALDLVSLFTGSLTAMDFRMSNAGPLTRSQLRPVLECCESNYCSAEPSLQLLSPNSVLDCRMDDLFSEGEDDCPQTPKENRVPLVLRCPGAPLKLRPIRKATKGKRKGVRILKADFEAAFPGDAAMQQRRRMSRLESAQQLLEEALRS
ncbi:hypothetical protein KFL_000440140 [Klebsormidium nitens]|uniref:Uncharacterized protein n=1 Tax=Klebsormidium nitens TaxID=105231 RepID=A0A1Y1HQE3_KLENI|nr:hypothetical protein KFL_000440140 [Klebsormidium nitens]|eukprot:GAQ80012.1 hypothetical protein KFL_000440140 [Klebsormidium nitens]